MTIKELKEIVVKLKGKTIFESMSPIEMVQLITYLFEKIEELEEKQTPLLAKMTDTIVICDGFCFVT